MLLQRRGEVGMHAFTPRTVNAPSSLMRATLDCGSVISRSAVAVPSPRAPPLGL